jgi:DNA-directed RNA polymerase subunit F
MRIKELKPTTIAEAKEILDSMPVEEMEHIQRKTSEHLRQFAKVNAHTARRIVGRLVEEVKLTEEEAVETVNILPETLEELRALVAGWKKLLTTETLQQILRILTEEKKGSQGS